MSYCCTLHPVDPRVAQNMITGVKGKRTDWSIFIRLWRKKQMINRINFPFKDGLAELLADHPLFNPDIHLRGRPFFIHSDQPEEVIRKIVEFYGANSEKEVLTIYMEELKKFSEFAYFKRLTFLPKTTKEPNLGVERVLRNLYQYYKSKKYSVLAGEIGFILAQLLGYAYPYWYMDNYGLSFLEELGVLGWNRDSAGLANLFQDLPEIARFLPGKLERNLSAGIYLDPLAVKSLLTILIVQQPYLIKKMEEKQLLKEDASGFTQKTIEALTYAQGHGFGLMEATDIFEEKTVQYP